VTSAVRQVSLPAPHDLPAKARRENFAVASRILPAAVRSDLMALYGFARLIDDIGDEAEGDRGALLDLADAELDLAFAGDARHPVFVALEQPIRSHGLAEEPFRRLIQANRQDQVVARYPTYADLRAYCALSADPVGRLVLAVMGAATPARIAMSDNVCTGLQLVEHWQDVAEDLARGRIYLPLEDMDRFGVAEADLGVAPAGANVRRLMAFEAARAHALLADGVPLAASLPGRMGMAVGGFAGGGTAALDALGRAGFDVLGASPRPARTRRAATVLWFMARGSARRLAGFRRGPSPAVAR
jgi:squalene synthase HpnC